MTKRDIYQEITDKIIAVLDQVNLDDYQAPFAGLAAQGLPANPTTDHQYQGINIPSLWVDQQVNGFESNQWATFKQWKDKGAQVRKGEKGSPIIFFKTLQKTAENTAGEPEEFNIPMMRFYTVFNASQVDGYDHHESGAEPKIDLVTRIDHADRYCTQTGADIRHGGLSAFYRRSGDFINLPDTAAFVDTPQATATENYYATLFHELTHWTGAPKRLDRDKAKTRQDRERYAFEELIAELGAAFLCSKLAIVQTPREDHALYIKSWLAALKNNKKFIFKASAQAARAVAFLDGFQE
uniref:ArdC family protein n=1 Tax=Pararhizobium sp. IMCC3301 TaxID=3067904 RepID=UPI0027405B39|nr:zincin-like metallopeptidase domain-containing protein [Pararhizobium sp. IMCC3301]